MIPTPIHTLRTKLPLVSSVLDTISGLEGVPIIVGGAVRDWLMGTVASDFDIEIFNINSLEHLEFLLKPLGKLELVSHAFGVLRYRSAEGNVDFTLPRKEHKISDGHSGFSVEFITESNFKDAAVRRDFTINAIGIDWLSGAILDPYNGQTDIRARCVRHISSAFTEDPVRVLRAAQLVARLGFSIDGSTRQLCRSMSLKSLTARNILEELTKMILYSKTPSTGLDCLVDLGVGNQWPDLGGYHRHIYEWTSGLVALDRCKSVMKYSVKTIRLPIAVWLFPTLGLNEKAPMDIANSMIARIFENATLRSSITALLRSCDYIRQSSHRIPTDVLLRKTSTRVVLREVTLVLSMFPDTEKIARYIFARSSELGILDHAPEPLVRGKDLVGIGIPPGPHIGDMIKDFYTAQLEGKITSTEAALTIAKDLWDS